MQFETHAINFDRSNRYYDISFSFVDSKCNIENASAKFKLGVTDKTLKIKNYNIEEIHVKDLKILRHNLLYSTIEYNKGRIENILNMREMATKK